MTTFEDSQLGSVTAKVRAESGPRVRTQDKSGAWNLSVIWVMTQCECEGLIAVWGASQDSGCARVRVESDQGQGLLCGETKV